MPDWSIQPYRPFAAAISSFDAYGRSMGGDLLITTTATSGSAIWPAANRAIYVAFSVDQTVTAYQMGFEVGTQSGNYDIGIYDVNSVLLVSTGSTAVPVAGMASADITDTVLTPGNYFMALCIDNVTAAVQRHNSGSVGALSVMGVQDQDVGAVTLPNPAVMTVCGAVYVPVIVVSLRSVW